MSEIAEISEYLERTQIINKLSIVDEGEAEKLNAISRALGPSIKSIKLYLRNVEANETLNLLLENLAQNPNLLSLTVFENGPFKPTDIEKRQECEFKYGRFITKTVGCETFDMIFNYYV